MLQLIFRFLFSITAVLVISLPPAKTIALTATEVEAIAWQVSVLISPNLTAKGDQLLIPGSKTGSGVIIGRERSLNGDNYSNTYYVLTALHVVAKKGGFHAIAMPDGAVYYVEANPLSNQVIPLGEFAGDLGESIEGLDLAILKFVSDRDYAVAPIATTLPTPGEPIFINGWPNPVNLGIIQRDRRFNSGNLHQIVSPPQADGGYSFLYTNETESGMSGAPIFNANGELIGIHGRGRGIENRCSSPEMNLNHSCGMPILPALPRIAAEKIPLPLNQMNQNAVTVEMIQYGLRYRGQSDHIQGDRWPLTVLGTVINPDYSTSLYHTSLVLTNPETNVNINSVNLANNDSSNRSTAAANTLHPPKSPPVYYVNPQTGNNHATAGRTPENPVKSISYILQSSLPPGTIINLAPGIYNSSNETFPLKLPTGVILQGNPVKTANQNQDNRETIREVVIVGGGFTTTQLWGQQNVAIVASDRSQITGITVSNPLKNGTGIWVETGHPIIRDNIFRENNREGIFVGNNASPIIANNQFIHNINNGISISNQASGEIQGNVFNHSEFGMAIAGNAAPEITDNQFQGHRIGLIVTEQAHPKLNNNTIENNREYGVLSLSTTDPEIANNNQIRGNPLSNQLTVKTHAWGLPLPPKLAPSLVFGCLEYDAGLATWVSNGKAAIPQPMILWPPELLQPTNRCQSVAGKLNGIVAQGQNLLENLFLKTGRVNNSPVVCLVSDWQSNCQTNNMLFPLQISQEINQERNQARINPIQQLQNLLAFPLTAPGNPVQQLEEEAIAPLQFLSERLQSPPGLWFVQP